MQTKSPLRRRLLALLIKLIENNRLEGFSLCEDETGSPRQMIPVISTIGIRQHIMGKSSSNAELGPPNVSEA